MVSRSDTNLDRIMYPSQFEYIAANSVDDAISLLSKHDNAEILAGGQSLVPLQKTRFASPDQLIDITGIDALRYVEETTDEICIGALTSHTVIQNAAPVTASLELFSECISQIADWQVRNQGTFGGTVVEADPAGDYMPVLKVTNPEFTIAGPDGTRTTTFEEFYLGMLTVDLEEAEIVTEGRFSKLEPDEKGHAIGSSYKKYAKRSGDYAIAGVAAILEITDEGTIDDARVSIGAVGPLERLRETEALVEGTDLSERVLADAAASAKESVIPDDDGLDGDYQRAMAGEFTKRALESAYARAQDEQ